MTQGSEGSWAKFRRELLNAPLDMSLCRVDQAEPSTLRIIMNIGLLRIALAVLFGLPALLLLGFAIANTSSHGLLLALMFCPAMLVVSALFGFSIQEKSFTPALQQARQSLRLLNLKMEAAAPLPKKGTIKLTHRTVTVKNRERDDYEIILPLAGYDFVGHRYAAAQEFSSRLAGFLGYQLVDEVPADKR